MVPVLNLINRADLPDGLHRLLIRNLSGLNSVNNIIIRIIIYTGRNMQKTLLRFKILSENGYESIFGEEGEELVKQ